MNPTDHWNDLESAGDVPPPSTEVLAHARRQLETRRPARRRLLIPVLAAAGTAAAIVGAIAVHESASGPSAVPVPGIQPSQAPSSAAPTTPSITPSQGIAASCVAGYSPAELRKRAFAFDGTVVKIVKDPGGAIPSYLLTLRVGEWFKPADGPSTVTVRTITPPHGAGYQMSVPFPDYTDGSRLLVAGEPQWGGTNPLKDAYAFGCGFSRGYNAADAATWRKLLTK
ncbi:hypothetical protein AB0E63_14770 [Kribbella sp. NPDC026596]|uniref:hypothetical protein n=1 Tax=Kribbella sp. NPDC026596 TaxID=3155122 RepID=UPI0033E74899